MNFFAISLIARLGCWFFRYKPLVVLYHGVTNKDIQDGILNYRGKHVFVSEFEREIKWLKKHFEIVPLSVVEKMVQENDYTKKNICAITFDDGYKNNYTTAFPVLKKYDVPATIFVTTDFVDKKSFLWPDRLEYMISKTTKPSITVVFPKQKIIYPLHSIEEKKVADNDIRQRLKKYSVSIREEILSTLFLQTKILLDFESSQNTDFSPLTWDDMKEMQNHNVTIGAHTVTHPILSQQSYFEQTQEISNSFSVIKNQLGQCVHFAHPNGQEDDWNEDTVRVFNEQKIPLVWATLSGRVSSNSLKYALPRISLDYTKYGHARFVALVSNVVPSIKSMFEHFI